MAILTPQQRQVELERKAGLGIAPTDKTNQAQYNAIVEKNKAVQVQTPKPVVAPVASAQNNTPTPNSGIKPATPQTPYTEGANTYRNDGTNIYKNDVVVPQANYKYIPTEIGGLRGAGTGVNTQPSAPPNPLINSIGTKIGATPTQQTTKQTSQYDWNKLTNGSYESVKEFNALRDSMVGQDRNKYINDQQALTLYDYANGQKSFGNVANNQYSQIGYANDGKRYANDISRADQTVMLLHTQLGEQGFKDFAQSMNGKNGLEITKILNSMGMNGVDVGVLQQRVNEALGVGGVTTTPQSKDGYVDWASGTNINGQNVLETGLGKNYSVKKDNSIGLNDMITNVNGQQMHIYNALKYGTGENANKDLYASMLDNEKRSGGTEAVPLKARAELAPETMTPQMKMDYQEQLQIEDMLSKQMFVLEQINQMSGNGATVQPSSPSGSSSSDIAGSTAGTSSNAPQVTSGSGGGIASGGLAGGSMGASGVSGGQGDMSGYDFTIGQGKNAQSNVLDGLTPEQINQMNAILQKMNGINK